MLCVYKYLFIFRAIGIFTVGIGLFVSVCCYAGVLVYAEYWKCDPKSVKYVEVNYDLI